MLESFRKFYRSSIGSFSLAVMAAICFRQSIASPYKIPSGSMIPTLKIGDFIFVSKTSYALKFPVPYININLVNFRAPQKGDVVVFIYPHDRNLDFIKRVVGTPGDKIQVVDDILHINDVPVDVHNYADRSIIDDQTSEERMYAKLSQEITGKTKHLIMQYPKATPELLDPILVPEGHLFVMGDNRDNSRDSRFWGFVPIVDVRGRAKFVWLSLDYENPYFEALGVPIPRIRWDRFGMKII